MILAAALAAGAASPALDWAAELRRDAEAIHRDIAANHAGPVDRLNPDFSRVNDAGLAEALARSRRVSDYPGYWWALRGYVARFDDGHVQLGSTAAAPALAASWPGFLTSYNAHGDAIVRTRANDAPVPIGATLTGCDGHSADALGQERVGAFFGRWMLASQRVNQGWRLFLDLGNPFVTRPLRCTFQADGRTVSVTLAWRPLPDAERPAREAAVRRGDPAPIAARTLVDGTRWYSLSSFDGDPASPAGKALPLLIEAMRRDRPALVRAPRTVVDLRGNGGGSSDWSHQIAQVLWGEAAVAKADLGSSHVEWRASPANVAFLRANLAERSAVPQPPEVTAWYNRAIGGMVGANAAGHTLWREPDDPPAPLAPAAAPPVPLAGPVYLVTDPACASACLDAVDLFTALGAVQLGAETSADTLYMDDRDDTLPSGLAEFSLPMKVYRGRLRGSNVPVTPTPAHRFLGDLRDSAALERWVMTLPNPS